jgi:hypothetical protein
MALFLVKEKSTGKTFGVYSVSEKEDTNWKDISGTPVRHTQFLIYKNSGWMWIDSNTTEPFDMEGLFDV